MNSACAGPPTRNQVSSASDWLASRRPRSSLSCALSCGTRSGNMIKPSGQHFAAEFADRRAVGLCLRAQRPRIDAGLAQFDGVADQPILEPRGLGLQMKLQGELRWLTRKRLHRTVRRKRKPLAARRQFAIVTV